MKKWTYQQMMKHLTYYTIRNISENQFNDLYIDLTKPPQEQFEKYVKTMTEKSMIQSMCSYMGELGIYNSPNSISYSDDYFDKCFDKLVLENKMNNL